MAEEPAASPIARRRTFGMLHDAERALTASSTRERLSVTDVANRAVLLYDRVGQRTAAGAELILREPDGREYLLWIL